MKDQFHIVQETNEAQNSLFRLNKKRAKQVTFRDRKFLPFTLKEYLDSLFVGESLIVEDTGDVTRWLKNDDRFMYVNALGDSFKGQLCLTKTKEREYGVELAWSVVFITRGTRDDLLKRCVDSVIEAKIPVFEIIIVGADADKKYSEWHHTIRHIPFIINDDRGWITRKKNIGCENAKFDNILVMHDDVVLDKDWCKQMFFWGNKWECANMSIVSNPTLSWFRETGGRNHIIEPGDWHEDYYIGGHVIALKKFVWNIVKWNETLFHGGREDVVYTRDLIAAGFLPRVAPGQVRLIG